MAQSPDQQMKPLAPFISSTSSHLSRQEDIEGNSLEQRKVIGIRKCILCCGCVTALLVLFFVIIIVLGFTVYNVKEPEVRMNGVTPISGTFTKGDNVILVAHISVKNTNAFTLRFGNTTTIVYYDGVGIGEGTAPPGKAKARRTIRVNSTLLIVANKLLDNPNLDTDLRDQALNISSYTQIHAKVKILNMFPRNLLLQMNCTIGYNITSALIINPANCLGTVDI
ncbi:hypothetical protein VNO78_10331 [Psophocarpus tetragonolobus]|uniref:Late embryogenesis abundant protein LEA-2 subgroup domain-containing protein n=1 Tax=Psophocarpus tetragonolobus TaxID=3891 RepID=A0AAN9SJM3_PSOTE